MTLAGVACLDRELASNVTFTTLLVHVLIVDSLVAVVIDLWLQVEQITISYFVVPAPPKLAWHSKL